MKYLLFVFIFIPALLQSQSLIEQYLDSITTQKEAEDYLKTVNTKQHKIISFNKIKHKTRIAEELFNLPKGGKKSYSGENTKTYYKVLEKRQVLHYRVSVIAFNSEELSLQNIEQLRQKIITMYNSGYRFKVLAKLYSMEHTSRTGGDLGWLTDGDMPADFEQAVFRTTKPKGSIFTLDLPNANTYYVVLKTHVDTYIDVIDVLKLTELIH
ncbi:MAG: hypothetical protein HKP28_07175 [Winogradskyella sp.]|nr:hypothetical protein [Winogradskyella sp.]